MAAQTSAGKRGENANPPRRHGEMARRKNVEQEDEGVGITNRGIDRERPAQDYVMDSVEGMERSNQRDDMSTGDRLHGKSTDIGRNLDPYIEESELTLTPEEQSGGERHIDSRDANPDHSHH
jgi:hypothetical protein